MARRQQYENDLMAWRHVGENKTAESEINQLSNMAAASKALAAKYLAKMAKKSVWRWRRIENNVA